MNLDHVLDLLAASAYRAYSLSLCGSPTPAQRDYYTRVSNPQPGDKVLEITNWKAKAIDRIGLLISCDMEDPPNMDRETYDEDDWGKPWPPYQERVWRIVTLDDRNFYWTNANFIVIPSRPFDRTPDRPAP